MSTYLRPVVCSTPRLTHSEVTTVGQKHNNNNNLARDGATWSGSALSPPLLAVRSVFSIGLCRSTPRSTQSEGLFDVPVPTYRSLALVTNCDFLNLRMLCTITMDSRSLWMRFRFSHVLTCTLHVLYMYFTCTLHVQAELKAKTGGVMG